MYVINLIHVTNDATDVWVDNFISKTRLINPEQKIRDIVYAYLNTKAGKQSIADTDEQFNWADAITYIPVSFWAEYGLSRCYKPTTMDVKVNINEVLCQQSDED